MSETQDTANSKIKGKVLAKIGGLTVYGTVTMPKRRGKARLLIQIRQDKTHDWRVSQSLNYGRSLDVLFATDTERDNKGRLV
jgi:hypothetical protein